MKHSDKDKSRKPPMRNLDPNHAAVQERIGNELRAMYDSVTREPIPDRFLKLLEELEAKDRGRNE